jgi:hypothetical protein
MGLQTRIESEREKLKELDERRRMMQTSLCSRRDSPGKEDTFNDREGLTTNEYSATSKPLKGILIDRRAVTSLGHSRNDNTPNVSRTQTTSKKRIIFK